ncbi:hypothetical protein GCK72_013074 [Caenorhabditis remanei]|uniref:Uncharacterized protein n=1 Tax=Caenorhabditis remanei TaxID=31234 RepID=A0A6A5GPM4_CAERE|nr:hypothetical protein GCK72_013074 [Caenorhabditis remanei]KAF1756621.1 hypothetical protein GCK72_013074 [Caenorhabditis remanei]
MGKRYWLKEEVIKDKFSNKLEVILFEKSKKTDLLWPKEKASILADPRGINFFQDMIDGKIGLPRQLFYYVIGTSAPQFAGPENSALFYHLLSIGFIPEDFSAHFTQLDTPCLHIEPKFVEERTQFNVKMLSDARNIECYRAGLDKEDDNVEELVGNYGKGFIAAIGDYFSYQRKLKSEGYKNWTTPVLEVIEGEG